MLRLGSSTNQRYSRSPSPPKAPCCARLVLLHADHHSQALTSRTTPCRSVTRSHPPLAQLSGQEINRDLSPYHLPHSARHGSQEANGTSGRGLNGPRVDGGDPPQREREPTQRHHMVEQISVIYQQRPFSWYGVLSLQRVGKAVYRTIGGCGTVTWRFLILAVHVG